jgi:glycosyltransferase involved in cell wall biosynthesis
MMACGTFPILGRLPQYDELIQDRINGILVDLDDTSHLADSMKAVLEDDELRRKASDINRRIIEEVADKKRETRKVLDLYEELIGGGH